MKIDLKTFQEIATRDVLDELADARESVIKNKLQAVVLSAPTGSGKTITVASVIDQIFGGGDILTVRPNTIFLWLSDSPELNVQSKAKLLAACDYLPFHRMVTIDSESFDEERLHSGHVYFINTQLLGKDKRLTQGGDKRQYTFWQTIANTVVNAPEDFVLIIDEAHRGAAANDRNRTPIMQKFILGSDSDGLPPVPLVLGMSATPQRFTALLGNTNRTQRPINITADDVRSSGLLKDMIVVRNPKANTPGDLTLLEHAAARWQQFTQLWKVHCDQHEKETVRPILVVQVQDGTDKTITRTSLPDVVRVIERQSGPLAINEIVHCFQDHTDIEAGGRIIRKIEASRIQDTSDVKVVLFKTALTTGWDCPRAEVMMSFRRAQDATSIAQLVGRMIRTPLARRIVENEVLNTVELSLPHYDSEALEAVLKRLRNPEAEEGLPSRVETSTAEFSRNPKLVAIFDRLKGLPTYSVKRVPKMGDVKRVLRLAGMLVHAGIDQNADEKTREVLTTRLRQFRDSYASTDASWNDVVREGSELAVDVSVVAIGQMTVTDKTSVRMSLSEENIDQLFDSCGRKLAAGEGLHRTYWKHYHNHAKPNEAKLELFAVMRHPDTQPEMDKLAFDLFDSLWAKNKAHIQNLSLADKNRFNLLRQASGKAIKEELELPNTIVEKKEGDAFTKHLYCNADGEFFAKFNSWERSLLEQEMKHKEFVGWLRNPSRRDWALCIPYELSGIKGFYPDFVIVRKKGNAFEIDILEPHDDTRTDTWAKAKGLAVFADDHGLEFGRLIIARKKDGKFQIADMNDKRTRDRARKMQAPNDLDALFA
jgi:type III restriction enzyme